MVGGDWAWGLKAEEGPSSRRVTGADADRRKVSRSRATGALQGPPRRSGDVLGLGVGTLSLSA